MFGLYPKLHSHRLAFSDEPDRVGVRGVGIGAWGGVGDPDLDLRTRPGDLQCEFTFRAFDRFVTTDVTTGQHTADVHFGHGRFHLLTLDRAGLLGVHDRLTRRSQFLADRCLRLREAITGHQRDLESVG